MRHRALFGVILLLIFILPNTSFAAPKVADLLKELESIEEIKSDLTARSELTQQKEGEGVKVYDAIYYRHDADDSFLVVMTGPESEKGNGYLKQGDNFWMYRRNTRTFQHINRDESIEGTDAKEQDFEHKKLSEMYQPVTDSSGNDGLKETKLGDIPVFQFEVVAKIEDVSYPKQVYWIRQDNFLPLKIQSYSLSGTLMQTSYFLKYTQLSGRYLCIKSIYIDEFEKGNKTLLDIQSISLQKVDDYVFTKAYLENLSK